MIEANCELTQATEQYVTIRLPSIALDAWAVLRGKLQKQRVAQVYVKIGYPRKPRTTGDESQNHHLNGHIAQLCQYTGDEFDDIKMEIKRRAIKRGYPFRTDSFGNVVPQSEADSSTVECALLIEEAHDVAAFLNIKLKET
jgi:hypothetical protein